MRTWLMTGLVLLVVGIFPATATAFTWTRIQAPEFDVGLAGPIGVSPLRIEGSRVLDGTTLAADLAGALGSTGLVEARLLSEAEKAPGIAVEITGTARVEVSTDYGTTPVQREYWVWRERRDNDGRYRQVQEREYRTVYIRTESQRARIELDLRAVHVSTRRVLGSARVAESTSNYWQEDYGWRNSAGAESLLDKIVPKVVAKGAARFAPQALQMKRSFRPERNADAVTRSGIDSAEAGDLERALQLFTEALANNPRGAADLYGNLAMVYEALGRLTEAEAALETGLAQPVQGGHDLRKQLAELRQVRGLAPALVVPPVPQPERAVPDLVPPGDSFPRVVRIDGGEVFLDAGAQEGWVVGDLLQLEQREPVYDLEGTLLGEHQARAGRIRLIKVYERFSVAVVESLEEGQLVRVGLVAVPIDEATDTAEL